MGDRDANITPEFSQSLVGPDHFFGLPHKPPFVFVRELVRFDPGRAAECATSFDPQDAVFAGHFPGNPMVPGVILTEALAQTAGIAAASGTPDDASRPRFLLSAIRQMKFFSAVRPGQRIVLRAERIGQVNDLLQFEVKALVDDLVVATGQIVLNTIPEWS
jgi:3-hydroxyacyl-[acyl-carrier-protein] dehydratase